MVHEFRVHWTTATGGTGTSAHWFLGASSVQSTLDATAARVRNFYFDAFEVSGVFGGLLPDDVTISFDPEVREVDESTGLLVAVHSAAVGAPLTGTDNGAYSGATGAVVTWNTATVAVGQRVRGRTFLVPIAAGGYDTTGRLSTTMQGEAQAAADGLIAASIAEPDPNPLVVFSRTHLLAAPVGTANVPDMAAVLRSRRD
jgi:hypothetical protein